MAEDYKTGIVKALYSDGHAVKVGVNRADPNEGEWYDVDEKIQKYVTKDYKGVDVKYKDKQDGKRQVIFLLFKQDGNKAPETTKQTPAEKSTDGKSICPDCGKEKDPKYPKCWACNNKNPAKKTGTEEKRGNEYWDKKDLEIKRGNALNAAASAIGALGQVDSIETLQAMIITLAEGLRKDYLMKEIE